MRNRKELDENDDDEDEDSKKKLLVNKIQTIQ